MKRLINISGKRNALEIVLKGDMVDATKAFDLSIVDGVVEKKKSLVSATLFAQSITNNRPLKVINTIMRSIRNHEKLTGEAAAIEDIIMFTELAKDSFEK
jgi:enoyl-CoA hydratase/carnithine racemase